MNNEFDHGTDQDRSVHRPKQNDSQPGKAMAYPARIAILEHLIKVNACVCGDLVRRTALAQATVSSTSAN